MIGGERSAVQRPLVDYAEQTGWKYLSREDAVRLRRGEAGVVLHDIFIDQVQKLNPGSVDLRAAEEILGRIIRVPPSIEGNLAMWEFLRGLKTVFVPDEGRERNVTLIADDPARNTFHVTDELVYTNGVARIRADVVLLVNGIPVIVVETKSSTHLQGIAEGFDQIARYHRDAPELVSVLQLHALTHLVQFFYGATWSLSRKGLFNWKDEAAGNFEDLVKAFVTPERVLNVLRDCLIFTRVDGELTKAVLRPHQMSAAARSLARSADPARRRGLVWHTQGSGKTFTMISVAKKLIESSIFENPTVLMLVDRNELEAQLFANLAAVGFGSVVVAESKRHLQGLFIEDHRGLILSTIHKFEDMPAGMCTRENLIVLVDEAHRTTGGDLGNFLMAAMPNATYLGFTGTPIDKTAHGRGTFKVFGIDDPDTGYLDKYSIRESIEDGTTVPLHYALAPNELQVDRDVLEREFLNLATLEGVSDVEELNRALDGAVNLKNMLKNPERREAVASFVADHYRVNVEPMGLKAILVGVDREACALYKRALDQRLPPAYSQVVISANYNDSALLSAQHLTEEQEGEVRRRFRKADEVPKILIVTEKLLTGFDAPILYAMYLDKPMRDHVLLQAIARVNRPYEEADGRPKTSGLIVDFVGLFANLEKALAFDSADIEGVIQDLEVLRQRFEALMIAARTSHLKLAEGKNADKAAEAVLEHFRSEAARSEFYQFFRELEEIHDILSPDAFLRPFLDDYGQLGAIYRLLRASYEPWIPIDKSFSRKTAELVQRLTSTHEVISPEQVYDLGPAALSAIADSDKPDTVKVFNLLKAIQRTVEEEGRQAPYLVPIGERAEQIIKAFGERQVSTHEALEQLTLLLSEAGAARAAERESDLPVESFGVFWLLDRRGVASSEAIAHDMADAFGAFPHWRESEPQEREVRLRLYKSLLDAGVEKVSDVANDILDVLRKSLK